MKRLLIIVIILAIGSSGAYCQKIFSARGTAKVKLDDHLSRDETMEIAREYARHMAIENLFGTSISKDAFVDIENGESSVVIKGGSELKGEWLKTNKESFTEETRKVKNSDGKGWNTEIWIVCNTEGKVREIVTPKVDLQFMALNCPDQSCETSNFENGDPFYLYFRSPVNGYLSIYLVDQEQAFRILPYSEMPSKYLHNVPVEADEEYLFFDAHIGIDYFENFPYYYSDELILETEEEQTFYQLYLIFSPKPFSKPILEEEVVMADNYIMPKYLPRKQFEIWVQDSRIFDTDFYFQTLNLRVRK
jgi:hypothetical protein